MNLDQYRSQGKSANEKLEKALVALATSKVGRRGTPIIGYHDDFTYATNKFALVVVHGFATSIREGRESAPNNCLDLVTPTGEAGPVRFDPKLMRNVLRVFDAVGEEPVADCRDMRLYLSSPTVQACIMGKRK